MKNVIVVTLVLMGIIWGCSDDTEEVVQERLLYNVTCYSSNGTVVIESTSYAHPGIGSQSSYAWKDINGTHYETSLRCKCDRPPPVLNEK